MPRALITGITSQGGAQLVECVLAEEYEVHGTIRMTNA
jgi:GDP-D-mannose dehydratase